jgi:hypothetical protein
VGGDFGYTVGSGAMVVPGKNRFSAEGFDGLLDAAFIGCDYHTRDKLGATDPFDDVLDHRPAGNGDQGLPRKANGRLPRGDHD